MKNEIWAILAGQREKKERPSFDQHCKELSKKIISMDH